MEINPLTNPDDLEQELIYTQVLTTPKTTHQQVRPLIKQYVSNALNDPRKSLESIVFYKCHVYIGEEGEDIVVKVNFFLYSKFFWTDEVQQKLKDSYLTELMEADGATLKLVMEETYTKTYEEKRKPVYYDMGGDEEEASCTNIPGDNCCQKFTNWWLIVPRVQWDFFDLMYQMYTFDITHQGFFPKFVHFFTIPTNVMLSMVFVAQWSLFGVRVGTGPVEINANIIMLGILVLAYMFMGLLRKSWPWGLATSVVLCVLWMTGNLWYSHFKTPTNPWYNPTTIATNPIMWSYIISFLQASSHMCTPQLPPYITGATHWESLHVFFCQKASSSPASCRKWFFRIASLAAFPIFSVGVAWFSWPHLIGTEVIYIMAGIGYQPSFFDKYFRVAEKAELSGNPGLDVYPTKPEELMNEAPALVEKMKGEGLVSADPKLDEVVKTMVTMDLGQKYFNRGVRISREQDLQHLAAARKCMHLKTKISH